MTIPAEATLLVLARYQAFAWTIVDAICVALVLDGLDLLRRREGRGRAWWRWALLAASLVCFPYVLLAPDRAAFFYREAVVVSLHFAALLLGASDVPRLVRLLRRLESGG